MHPTTILATLRRGESCWPAAIALRLTGCALLGACLALARLLVRQVQQPATPADFALGLGVVACLWAGLALVLAGPELFHLLPLPRSFA